MGAFGDAVLNAGDGVADVAMPLGVHELASNDADGLIDP